VLIPIALAVLLSFVLTPMVDALQRRKLGRVFSSLIVLLAALLMLAGIGAIITLQMGRLVEEMPQYKHNIATKIAGLREATRGTFMEHAQEMANAVTEAWSKDEETGKGLQAPQPTIVRIQSNGASEVLSTLGPAAEFLAESALVLVLVVFILIQQEDLRNRFVRLIGDGRLVPTTRAIDEASRRISRFLISQVLVNAGFGLALTLGLLCLGVPYAFLWGVFAMLLRFIPYVGIWGFSALLVAFSIFVLPGWTQPIGVIVLLLALEVLTAQVVEPLVFGHSTGLSTVALLISAAFWAWLWGPVGLILSTPITACLVVVGRYVPSLEFFEILLGDQLEVDTHVLYYQRLLARDQDEATELIERYLSNHPIEAVFDDVLVPALVLANFDRARGELTGEDEQSVRQITQTVLDEVVPQAAAAEQGERPEVWVLGTPAQGEIDALALRMFQQLLAPAGIHVDIVSPKVLTAELVKRVHEEKPVAVCVASLPPGGLSQARYLQKRLQQQCPDLKILVCMWGSAESKSEVAQRMSLSTHQVSTKLVESRNQIIPLVQLHTPSAPAAAEV
jgi:predicted PurR-regulated permease PerM